MKEALQELHAMVKNLGASSPKHRMPSIFFKDIKAIVENLDKCLEEERRKWHWGWFNHDLWEERKLQLEILKDAMQTVGENYYPDDMFLYFVCGEVLKNSKKAFWSSYNEFVEELEKVLDTTKPNQMNINSTYNVLYYKQLYENEVKRKDEIILAELKKSETKEKPLDAQVEIALEKIRIQFAAEYSELEERIRANIKEQENGTVAMEGVTNKLLKTLECHLEFLFLLQRQYPTVYEVLSKQPNNPLTLTKQEYTRRMVEASHHSRTSSQGSAADPESLQDSSSSSPRYS